MPKSWDLKVGKPPRVFLRYTLRSSAGVFVAIFHAEKPSVGGILPFSGGNCSHFVACSDYADNFPEFALQLRDLYDRTSHPNTAV